MKYLFKLFLCFVGIVNVSVHTETYEVDFYQMIDNAKTQTKWDCARLVYVLVQDAIGKVTERSSYITLYQQVKWIFGSVQMQDALEMIKLFAPKSEIYLMASSIARENNNEEALLVLQMAAEHEQKGWFARHATFLTYTFGVLCGYIGSSYIIPHKDLLLSYVSFK